MELEPIQPVPPIRRDMDILANRLPSTDALDGTTIAVELERGGTLSLALSGGDVSWQFETTGPGSGVGHDPYDAVEVRQGLFFVDFVASGGTRAFSSTST
jgi:hypothetical protein